MDPKDYQIQARRTAAPLEPIQKRIQETRNTALTVNLIGLMDEVGELASAVKKVVEYGSATIDTYNLLEEVGDCLWRLSRICDSCDLSLKDAMTVNIAKLKKRYPHAFSNEQALNRDLAGERNVIVTGPAMSSSDEIEAIQTTQTQLCEVCDGAGGYVDNEAEPTSCKNCDGMGYIVIHP